ncbi:hypothetical protein EXIGLDRAFT_584956, partial [Exidia glandulosa HHB12029]
SSMPMPTSAVSLPGVWSVPNEMLTYQPVTRMEALLQALLHTAVGVHSAQRSSLLQAHATMVLQNTYCARVKGQLAPNEKKAKAGKAKRLMGDGMPQLLTGDEFYQRVVDHDDVAVQEQVQRGLWEEARGAYEAAVADWKRSEAARKGRNELLTSGWKSAVAAWE